MAAIEEGGAAAVLEWSSIQLEPITCEVGSDPLLPTHLKLDLVAKEALPQVHWRVQFMLDLADQRKVIDVAKTDEAVSYEKGKAASLKMQFFLDLSQVSKSLLLNLGLLMISAVDGEGSELFKMSVVTQIEGDRSGGPLKRVFLDPR